MRGSGRTARMLCGVVDSCHHMVIIVVPHRKMIPHILDLLLPMLPVPDERSRTSVTIGDKVYRIIVLCDQAIQQFRGIEDFIVFADHTLYGPEYRRFNTKQQLAELCALSEQSQIRRIKREIYPPLILKAGDTFREGDEWDLEQGSMVRPFGIGGDR